LPGREAARARPLGAALCLLGTLASCHPASPPGPSFLLVVLDTTRVDAVSAYGSVAGSTPATDGLAAAGLRYARAYAQAPWTLPSHATLFTGLLPSQHGVGWARTRAPDALHTLAEDLREGGYETVGVSENPWVSEAFNLAQGFERFRLVGGFALTPDDPEPPPAESEVVRAVEAWLAARRRGRPFFLFVNILDAHGPWRIRPASSFLPAGVDAAAARGVPQEPARYLCGPPRPRELAILRGLYLGDVAAADAKLGLVLGRLRAAGLAEGLITIVTSDHGEHFGEHRLAGHQFSVREPLIHVPLVVHGVPGASPAVIEEPVQLADVMPTVLALAGRPAREALAGRPLPLVPAAPDARPLVAEHDDSDDAHAPDEAELARLIRAGNRAARGGCTPADPVFGAMRALVIHPLKLIWYARYPAELYDLAADPGESRDLAAERPAVVAALAAELERLVGGVQPVAADAPRGSPVPLAPEIVERLRALGYLGGEREGHAE
jgi:arylsulfatase A-like enzyme